MAAINKLDDILKCIRMADLEGSEKETVYVSDLVALANAIRTQEEVVKKKHEEAKDQETAKLNLAWDLSFKKSEIQSLNQAITSQDQVLSELREKLRSQEEVIGDLTRELQSVCKKCQTLDDTIIPQDLEIIELLGKSNELKEEIKRLQDEQKGVCIARLMTAQAPPTELGSHLDKNA